MILKKDNVERVVADGDAEAWKKKGFKELGREKEPESKSSISDMDLKDLRSIAAEKGIEGAESLNKKELLKVLKDVVESD